MAATTHLEAARQVAACSLVAVGVWLFPSASRAGAWTLGAGRIYVKQGVTYWQTDRKFASTRDAQLVFPTHGPVSPGDRIPFDPVTGGALRAVGLTTDVRLGLLDRLDLGASIPFIWTNFNTFPVDTVDARFGLGDLVLSTQTAILTRQTGVVAGKLEWKLPTGGFDPSVFRAPITEGQMDLALAGSAGLSLYPRGYANVELGWRFRFENPSNGRKPGDELFFILEAGAELPRDLMLKVAFDGLLGRPGVISRFGAQTEVPRRRLFSAWGGLLYRATKVITLEIDARYLIAGQDFPTGIQWLASVSVTRDLFGQH